MKAITKYQATDGKEFDSENECLDYEALITRVDTIMEALPPLPKDGLLDFLNGEGFIQHDKTILRNVQLSLLKEMQKHIDHRWIQDTIDNENVDPGYVKKLVDDYTLIPLQEAWNRFMCIDDLYREWGSPYFVRNPNEGKQVCVGGINLK